MTRFLSLLIMILVGAVALLFAASNRAVVDLTVWPLPFVVPAPIYAIVLAAVAFGILWGGVIGFVSAMRARRRARRETRRADNLEHDLQTLRDKIDQLEHRPLI